MANGIDLGFDMGGILGGVDAFTSFVLYALYGLLIAGVIWIIYYFSGFKHKVRVRQIAKDRTIVYDTKARPFKDKNKIPKWRLMKPFRKIAVPPDECLDVTNKGKLVAECYMTNDGNIIWINTNFDFEKDKKVVDSFEPFTSEERTLAIHEMREAESYNKKRWQDIAVAAVPSLSVVLIIAVFLLFLPGVIEELNMVNDRSVAVLDKANDVLESAGCGETKVVRVPENQPETAPD